MIDLLQEHLARLRRSITDPRAAVRRLGLHLRTAELGAAETEALMALPARIPAFLRGLEEIITGTDDDRIRGFAGGIFAYVFNPVDIIPAGDAGYLGYVEDAIICWRGLVLLNEEFDVLPSAAAGLESADAQRVDAVWNLLSDEVQDAVDAFLEQFDSVLRGVNF
jgi:uncharacterized membrane protein YkvA (DUF1232 family)